MKIILNPEQFKADTDTNCFKVCSTGGGYSKTPIQVGTDLNGNIIYERSAFVEGDNLWELQYDLPIICQNCYIVEAFIQCWYAVYTASHWCTFPLPFISSKDSTRFEAISIYYDSHFNDTGYGSIIVKPRYDSELNQIKQDKCNLLVKYQYIL